MRPGFHKETIADLRADLGNLARWRANEASDLANYRKHVARIEVTIATIDHRIEDTESLIAFAEDANAAIATIEAEQTEAEADEQAGREIDAVRALAEPRTTRTGDEAPGLCPCGCEGAPDDCTCGRDCRCDYCLVCDPLAIAQAEQAAQMFESEAASPLSTTPLAVAFGADRDEQDGRDIDSAVESTGHVPGHDDNGPGDDDDLMPDGWPRYSSSGPYEYLGGGRWRDPRTGSNGSAVFTCEHDCNPVCGCHLAAKCDTCGVCCDCDGCYCGED